MTLKQQQATELFLKGYNCAQSVAGAFAEELMLSPEQMLSMAAAFGGGFARTRTLCGAVSAIGLVISLHMDKSSPDAKGEVYSAVRRYTDRFEQKFSTINCGELLGGVKDVTSTPAPDARTAEYYKKRPCAAFVIEAAGLLEEYFKC